MNPEEIYDQPGTSAMGMDLIPVYEDEAAQQPPAERNVLYWQAPMNPEEIYDQPGTSKMGMDLIPSTRTKPAWNRAGRYPLTP